MFTYVFAFYLQKSNNTTIFEDNQVIIILFKDFNIFKITFVFELGEFGTGDGKTVRILGTRDARDYWRHFRNQVSRKGLSRATSFLEKTEIYII